MGFRWLVTMALAAILAPSGCAERPEFAPRVERAFAPASLETTRRVVLITIDGVRWQEIFGGVDPRLAEEARLPRSAMVGSNALLPSIRRLFFEHGTALGDPRLGGGIEASGDRHVSLPGYLELMTGARTGCRSNECAGPYPTTLLDDVAKLGSTRESVAAIASWDSIGLIASKDAEISLVRAGRTETDAAPPWPGNGRYRPDRETEALAIEHLLAHRPKFLWIALGDTDEWAHRHDYRGYLDALRAVDGFIGELAAHLDEMGDDGAATSIVVTTDHGRDDGFSSHGGPSSARVFLLARGGSVPRRGSIGTGRIRHLADFAPTVRTWLGLPMRSCSECGAAIPELFGLE